MNYYCFASPAACKPIACHLTQQSSVSMDFGLSNFGTIDGKTFFLNKILVNILFQAFSYLFSPGKVSVIFCFPDITLLQFVLLKLLLSTLKLEVNTTIVLKV